MKRLLKIMIILLLLEHAGVIYNETKTRISSQMKRYRIADEINKRADEVFREIGFNGPECE